MTINDSHCHFFSPAFFEALRGEVVRLPGSTFGQAAESIPRVLGWEEPGSPERLADRWAAELDGHGVARALLIASTPGDERSVATAVARHPGRFVGAFMLNAAEADAPGRAARAFGDLGLRVACLFPAMHHYRLDDDCVARLFEAARAHRGAIFAHCGVLTIGARRKLGLPCPFDLRLGDPLALAATAARFPEVPVIIPHFGAGFFREALIAAEACPTIYLDTSSSNAWVKYHPHLTLTDVFRQALAVVGPDRLLFGTDSSFFPRGWQKAVFEAQRAALGELGADDAVQARIFGATFDRLFPA